MPVRPATLGDRLRAARLDQGFTQAEAGDRIGVSPQWISTVEKGRRVPSLEWVLRYADALGVAPGSIDERLR